ncbi:hypothetical protein ACFV1W_30185 [Kitasatospora sp. NPDC059648]|uniref:hypothetical protein n=1 Tax=Kitasatospora sp. NPDC059648 TaxID=3346894 RepID=UPI0036AE7626
MTDDSTSSPHRLTPSPATLVKAAEDRLTNMLGVLTGRVKEVREKTDATAARLATIEGMDLPGKVVEMSNILQGLAHRDGKETRVWHWEGMAPAETYAALTHLVNWRETILRKSWPATYRRCVLPCWLEHEDVVQLTGSMCLMWHWAHTEADSSPLRQAEWMTRWMPGLAREIEELVTPCRSAKSHQPTPGPHGTINLEAEQERINARVLALQDAVDAKTAALAAAAAAP